MKDIKNVTVLGAGSMGAQIAALAAEAGYQVKIRDIEDKFLERGKETLNSIYDRRISRGRMTEKAGQPVGRRPMNQAWAGCRSLPRMPGGNPRRERL